MPQQPDEYDDYGDRSRQIPVNDRAASRPRPRPRPRPEGDDDAITVDTRGRRRRPSGAAGLGSRRPAREDAPGSSGMPESSPRQPRGDRRRRPPAAAYAGAGAGGGAATAARGPHRTHRVRWTVGIIVLIIVVWIASLLWAGLSAWGHVHRVAVQPASQPAAGAGRNVLMVGSDSRAGLTKAERHKFATGNAPGQRTDTIMLIHIPDHGDPTLVSIPRDSYVPIPGYGSNKINAAFSIGGPKLLVKTVEETTGLRIEGYLEVGFGGFANVVDSLGGVHICIPHHMKDKDAGINLQKGCQNLNGQQALGYVRSRHTYANQDFGRQEAQRKFLGALLSKAANPANVLLPWRLHSIGSAGAQAITIDKNDSMMNVAKTLLAVRSASKGSGTSISVPIANPNLMTPAGSAVEWDHAKAKQLFNDLNHDRPITAQP
ncbi:MAG TPA: LCP family protein [Segeticoccus sp.]|uniref:LCP family protein n=1 Tax=Segeticoccus sp. TaxID=2706531 RepID=UPI002D7FBBDF|nr:LCP family protein [Segeticoccus sp.]HET8598965.1 LCP family protein [Segeticoccus sp.]